VPVLISREVNIWREIVDRGAGLAAPDTVDGTVQLLREWMAKSPADRQQMRTAAAQCFTERFEIASATELLLKVLQNGKGGAS